MNLHYSESTLNFQCADKELLGIVSTPTTKKPSCNIGVIIVVGGPQYRVGSHRLFVHLARSLAEAGITALRFDYQGMGDSSGSAKSFLAVTPDLKAAIDALMLTHPHVRRIVLWGLCDGASASLLYCDDTKDSRISGLIALNPWMRSEVSLARTQVKHYYLTRLRQANFWRKLLSGKVAWSAISGLGKSIRKATQATTPRSNQAISFQDRMMRAWSNEDRKVLLILSGNDYTAKEFIENINSSKVGLSLFLQTPTKRLDIETADHTFSALKDRELVISATRSWILLNFASKDN